MLIFNGTFSDKRIEHGCIVAKGFWLSSYWPCCYWRGGRFASGQRAGYGNARLAHASSSDSLINQAMIRFSDASLQWLTDHQRLFPHLFAQLARGGVLAIQMPDNLDEPIHSLMRKVAATSGWAEKIGLSSPS